MPIARMVWQHTHPEMDERVGRRLETEAAGKVTAAEHQHGHEPQKTRQTVRSAGPRGWALGYEIGRIATWCPSIC
jgi:hypothetical protein